MKFNPMFRMSWYLLSFKKNTRDNTLSNITGKFYIFQPLPLGGAGGGPYFGIG